MSGNYIIKGRPRGRLFIWAMKPKSACEAAACGLSPIILLLSYIEFRSNHFNWMKYPWLMLNEIFPNFRWKTEKSEKPGYNR